MWTGGYIYMSVSKQSKTHYLIVFSRSITLLRWVPKSSPQTHLRFSKIYLTLMFSHVEFYWERKWSGGNIRPRVNMSIIDHKYLHIKYENEIEPALSYDYDIGQRYKKNRILSTCSLTRIELVGNLAAV